MSADNWTECPKCRAQADAKFQKVLDAPKKAYGKVDEGEYNRLKQAALNPPKLASTLREDYELGIIDGEFYVSYGGQCHICGFKHTFKHSEKVKP